MILTLHDCSWRLKMLHGTRGEQNKIIMKRWEGGRMRNEKLMKESWLVHKIHDVLWKYWISFSKTASIIYPGRRSKSTESEGGRSCCIRIWKVEGSIFCWCWRNNRKWSSRWKSRIALWLCWVHQGDISAWHLTSLSILDVSPYFIDIFALWSCVNNLGISENLVKGRVEMAIYSI